MITWLCVCVCVRQGSEVVRALAWVTGLISGVATLVLLVFPSSTHIAPGSLPT